ncbi:hypothetical protein [Ferrimonas pelagia]|uniref:MSHA biogenesis protein MshK n=1 Tax=Ferrimonas pelagia TaxID=1177826 RepID=A0ABP9FG44_9GAMM
MLVMIILLMLALPAGAADGIDPTEPPQWAAPVATVPSEGQKLESILIQGEQKLVLAGGETLREGDRWDQRVIRTIYADRIVLSDGEVIRLFPALSELSQERQWD